MAAKASDLAGQTPAGASEAQGLPDKVGRKDEEPRENIATADFSADITEEIGIAVTRVGAEHFLADQVYANGQDDKTEKQQPEKNSELADCPLL